jgi:hypothetical protein
MTRTTTPYTRTPPAPPPDPLPNRLIRLLSEARWLVFAVLCAFLTLALFTYSPCDPGWSVAPGDGSCHRSAANVRPDNWGGSAGAMLASPMDPPLRRHRNKLARIQKKFFQSSRRKSMPGERQLRLRNRQG